MSDSERIHRPGATPSAIDAADLDDPQIAPRERGLFGPARMDAVHEERQQAASSLRNRIAVMRKADGGRAKPAAVPEGGGAPLPGGVREKMEPRLGADLSGARVHTGGESAEAATAFGARAFTVGNEVHFNAGEFAPGTKEGDKLLAHELTHVVQGQRSGIQRKADPEHEHDAQHADAGAGADVSHPDEPAEKEADAVAEHVAGDLHGGQDGKSGAAGKGKQKDKDKDKKKKKKDKQHNAGGAEDDEKKDVEHDKHEGEKDELDAKSAVAEQQQNADGGAKGGGADAKGGGAAAVGQQAPPIAAKLSGISRKIFRTKGGKSGAAPAPGPAPVKNAAANPQAKEIETEAKSVKPVPTLDAYNAMIQSLNLLVTPQSKASVNLRVTKLKDAIARTRTKLAQIYKEKAPALINDWIDSRLPKAESKPGPEFVDKAMAAKEALLKSPTIDPKAQADAAKPLVNYGICAPEEAATDDMMDESGGIMKVYDVGSMWWSMDAKYQDAWKAKLGADAEKQFTAACKAKQSLVTAPPGQENKPPFKGAGIDAVFTKPLSGFVGQGKDAGAVGNFADAIQRFALNPGYYPSGAMFVVSAGAADVKQKKNSGAIKIGKPSIFNLLNFDENVYKEDDRQYGHLADAKDPSKPGKALELTCQGFPSEIYKSAKYLG